MIHILIQKINKIDYFFFNLINQEWKNPFFDKWMYIITDFSNWIWLFATGWLALFIFGKQKGKFACIVSVITALLGDNITSFILKPFFGRIRPDNIADAMSSTISFSFPSNHATNIFALATILTWYSPKLSFLWFTIAGIVGYSRIYVGAHFPLDVAGGAFWGISLAVFMLWLCKKIIQKINNKFPKIKINI